MLMKRIHAARKAKLSLPEPGFQYPNPSLHNLTTPLVATIVRLFPLVTRKPDRGDEVWSKGVATVSQQHYVCCTLKVCL